MPLEEFAKRLKIKHPNVPEQYYGRLAKIEKINEQTPERSNTSEYMKA